MQTMQKSISYLYNPYRGVTLDATRQLYYDSIVQERNIYVGNQVNTDGFDVITDAHFGRLEGEPIPQKDREHNGFFGLVIPSEILADVDGQPHMPFERVLSPDSDVLFGNLVRAIHGSVCSEADLSGVGIIPCSELSWSELPSHRPSLTMKVESNPFFVRSFLLYTNDDLSLAPGIPSVFHEFRLPCYNIHAVAMDIDRLATIMRVNSGQLMHCVSTALEHYRLEKAV